MTDEMRFDIPGELEAIVGKITADGLVAVDRAVIALTEVAEQAFKSVLTEKSHTGHTQTPARPGGPPAELSGALVGSLAKVVTFRPMAIGRVQVTEFYARYLQNGWYPNGGKRRSRRGRKDHIAGGGKQVRYPFVEDVIERVEAAAGPVIGEAVRII